MNDAADSRRALCPKAAVVDRELARLSSSLDLLLSVTPVDADEAFERFRAAGFDGVPEFNYRPLKLDLNGWSHELGKLPLQTVDDPLLAELFRYELEGLELRIQLLETRNTGAFLGRSIELFGAVDEDLCTLAEQIIDATAADADDFADGSVDAPTFAALADRELDHYRKRYPAFEARVEVRGDVASLICTRGSLLVPGRARFATNRVRGLLAHEIGTHLVTYLNAGLQPLRLLQSGLRGHDELQEGLAVLSEYLVGELSPYRMRLLAARVLATSWLVQGAGFTDVYRMVTQELGFLPRPAFILVMRVFRGGGLTKDAVYLRGLRALLAQLANSLPFELLLIGKFGFAQLSTIDQLLRHGLLLAPVIQPRYLNDGESLERLTRIRSGIGPLDLLSS